MGARNNKGMEYHRPKDYRYLERGTRMNAQLKDKEISEKAYIEVLNDIYGTVEICGTTFDSGYVLKELDPIAFRCGKVDYEDTLGDIWLCGECNEEFNWEDEADECCKPKETEKETK